MTQAAPDRPVVVAALIALQSLCAAYFLVDVLHDVLAGGQGSFEAFLVAETLATLALIAGIAFEIRVLFRLLERKAHLEQQVSLAARAFHDVVDARFAQWGLTAAERDVAHFTVKGMSISEIAGLRHSAAGTVKSQLNAIYRKAGVGNRGELLSLLIEDLVATGIETSPATAAS